jgi:glycosyltransferase involved in cell wall biosynthesis
MGHEATVLTGFPNHPTGVVPENWRRRLCGLFYRENLEGVNVVRTWLWPLPNRKAHERIRNYVSFCISSAVSGLRLARPDVVIGTSPQLLVALSAWWLAKWKHVPFVFEVRDLWPESLAAVGAGREGGPLHATLGAIAGFLYRKADQVVVVTPAFKEHLIRHWKIPEQKISIVENGVDTELFRPCPAKTVARTEGKFVVCYIGTMGMAHGLETLIDSAQMLQHQLPGCVFLLIGEGAEKDRIIAESRRCGLQNIVIIDQQPREDIPAYIAASDICLVMLKKTELFKTVIPTKMLEFMACERPVVVAVDGEARRLIEQADAGIFTEPGDARALAETICSMFANPEKRRSMGENGRRFIVDHLSRAETAQLYISTLQSLLKS